MTRHYLAIPVSAFLLLSMLLPVCAQTTPENPQAQPPNPNATSSNQTPKLSDEELARLYLVRKQYREAQDIFHKLTMEQPKNAVYWNELGITLHNQTELDAALKCYKKSVKLDPHYADAQNNIGTIYYERKKYSKAIRAYKKAISLRQDFAAFYLNLGFAYFGEKDFEQSIASFRKALQIDPDSFETARSRTGTVIQDRSVASDRARFYFLLAKSFAEYGNVERCVIYLKKARDEGYKDVSSVKSDPSFASVIKDPAMQEFLLEKVPDTAQP
jgi:tetratricopeptide (TPR) repeat protein